jgi:hypothetical protein
VPALIVLSGVLIPFGYLLVRAFQADAAQLAAILSAPET